MGCSASRNSNTIVDQNAYNVNSPERRPSKNLDHLNKTDKKGGTWLRTVPNRSIEVKKKKSYLKFIY